MHKNILVAIDGSDCSFAALDEASALATGLGAQLSVVTVCERPPSFAESEFGWELPEDAYLAVHEAETAAAKRLLATASQRIAPRGVRYSTHLLDAVTAHEGILSAAEQFDADLIVMGSHGRRGLQRLLLGSQAAKVLALSRQPLLVVKINGTGTAAPSPQAAMVSS